MVIYDLPKAIFSTYGITAAAICLADFRPNVDATFEGTLKIGDLLSSYGATASARPV